MKNKTSMIGVLPFRRVEDPGVMFESNDQEGACLLASCGEEILCLLLLLIFIGGIIFSIKYVVNDSQEKNRIRSFETFERSEGQGKMSGYESWASINQ